MQTQKVKQEVTSKVKNSPSQKATEKEKVSVLVSHTNPLQSKNSLRMQQTQQSSSNESSDDEDSEEMADFIAPDAEVERDQMAEREKKRKRRQMKKERRAKKQDSDDEMRQKKRKARKQEQDALDSEDLDLIREAQGGNKKGRLRKTGEQLKEEASFVETKRQR